MADSNNSRPEHASATSTSHVKAEKAPKPPNPVWRMLGLPRMRLRLPSRNWSIFLTITGGFSAAIIYDKREKKRAQLKWCKLVEHLGKETLDSKAMARKLTIFLESPPGDGLGVAQTHFKEYVKPVLVSSGLDWEFVQGRKEGDIRAALADKIRQSRTPEDEIEEEPVTVRIRKQNNIIDFDGPQGDIVIGRHTWKEYVRGLHEGWLGPLKRPEELSVEEQPALEPAIDNPPSKIETLPGITIVSDPVDTSAPSKEDASKKPEDNPPDAKEPDQRKPFITTVEYDSAPTPAQLPQIFDPSIPIEEPHVLGFSQTPLRLYRFLNRRHLADSIGRDVAAILLSSSRPYNSTASDMQHPSSPTADDASDSLYQSSTFSEQATALQKEEQDWHKSNKKRVEGEPERTWLDDVILDPRIAERMRKAELTIEDEERARKITVSEEEIEGWIKGSLRQAWRAGKSYITTPKAPQGPELGNIDDE